MAVMIRPAELDHATFMVPLVNDADGGCFVRSGPLAQPDESPSWDVGLLRVRSVDTPVSWNMGWIAEDAETPVGVLIIHQLVETAGQLEATILSPLWVPFVDLELEASGPGYIKTLSVIEAQRGQGVGGCRALP